MEFLDVIKSRQSVRSFNGMPVSEEALREMVAAAMEAPSWKNSQTSRYYVVSSEAKLAEIRANILPDFNVNSTKGAGAYIISTYVKNRSGFTREGVAEDEVGNGWGAYDLGLHDMLLIARAKELGLDTLIMGLRDTEAIRASFGVSDDEQIMSVIAVGYAENPTSKPPRKDLDSIAKFF